MCALQVGDSWFTKDDCSERCVCSPFNNVTCEAWRCSPAQECKVQDGQLGCVDTGTVSFSYGTNTNTVQVQRELSPATLLS